MDTRYILEARHRSRGAIRPVNILALLVIVLLGVAAWFIIIKPHELLLAEDGQAHPEVPAAKADDTKAGAESAANVKEMGLDELLSEARTAINQQRYLAPAGNNAFEFYLRALQKDPGDKVATDALREIFPFAADSAEQEINQRDFAEAQRQIGLLAKADPTNYTLTILRSKLDAQRELLDKQQQELLAQQKQQAEAAQKEALAKAAAEKQAQEQATEQAQAQAQQAEQAKAAALAAAKQRRREQQAEHAREVASAANEAQASEAGATTPAVLVHNFLPRYPTQARRSGVNGWVVVSFNVEPDGSTSNIRVVDAEPKHVFEHSATDAVERWRFSPAKRNGKPVASTETQRIVFNMNSQ